MPWKRIHSRTFRAQFCKNNVGTAHEKILSDMISVLNDEQVPLIDSKVVFHTEPGSGFAQLVLVGTLLWEK